MPFLNDVVSYSADTILYYFSFAGPPGVSLARQGAPKSESTHFCSNFRRPVSSRRCTKWNQVQSKIGALTMRELRMCSVGCTELSFLRRNPICELHLSRVLPSRGLILLNQLCVSNGTVIISHFDVGEWVGVVSNCTMGMLWAMNFEQFYFVFFVFFYSLVINSVIYLSLFFILLMNMASVSMIPSMLILKTIVVMKLIFCLITTCQRP